jgi:hypothetical protein
MTHKILVQFDVSKHEPKTEAHLKFIMSEYLRQKGVTDWEGMEHIITND